ncbi:hypothetical protein MFLAVUS_009686 [Mucor flavus]|uniref:Uncharacterized protein n=1 Tax=Mucor flavus TaxID=439312 RepID=A0ABP9ZAK8_9FUNG
MPNIKPHISTSTDGLRRKSVNPYNKPTETSYDQGYFPLKPIRFPSGTPETSVRAKKVYSDLIDEKAFLLELRERWAQKLQHLKEGHKFLSKMKSVKKDQVLGAEPLFTREENEPTPSSPPIIPSPPVIAAPCLPPIQFPTLSSNPIIYQPLTASHHNIPQPSSSPNQLNILDDFDLDTDNFTMNEPDILDAFKELEGLYSDDDDDEEEEEEEEDDEKARIALNLMLQEFGNSI